ncbi:probable tubulin polyglutamylase TTLL2 isoform X2 [Crotalus tigris]|uniref:probable tubulin polyglutamylase TTLL2 isoform X2 n=1 Tax=Crotalus tigris TaxID=88082 RepID=UPI00192F21FC|nr:probable tubulin polyglutamylase TTLL2 isoform X2 [Crotalus tigris]
MVKMTLWQKEDSSREKDQICTDAEEICTENPAEPRSPRKGSKSSTTAKRVELGGITRPLVFRLHDSVPSLVREILLERGWIEYDENEQDNEDWNLYWRNCPFRMTEHQSIKPWQRLNHHPETIRITRKDYLARHLKRMKGIYGTTLYEFSPVAFIMPNDYIKFITEYSKERQIPGKKLSYWICKPVDRSRGRGILIFQDIKDFVYDCMVIVQKYISNPLLISGYKWDLRIYVCVTSFYPLTIYIYEEGLVRFATEKFDLTSLDNIYAHLTNTSINKFGPSYRKDKEVIGSGCKWTFSKFRAYLRSCSVDDLLLWKRINHIVILTLLAITTSVPFTSNCFELFGFDILVDEKMKPWLLEVNHSPGLRLDCASDVTVKRKLLHDIVDLLNYKEADTLRKSRGANRRLSCFSQSQYLLTTQSEVPLDFLACGKGTKSATTSPSPSRLQINKRTPTYGRTASAYPRKTLTSQLREKMHMPQTPIQSKPLSKSRLMLRTSHSLCESVQSTHWFNSLEFYTHKPTIPPYFLSDKDRRPFPRVGDFILIFPFNDAALEASKNGMNVKSVIQEIHKLISKELQPEHQKLNKALVNQ